MYGQTPRLSREDDMTIPTDYAEDMQALLGADYPAFAEALLTQPPLRGLRVNTRKLSAEAFAAVSPWPLSPSALCRDAFIADTEDRVGLHPYHHAGLFYMQEPSASAVIEALDPQPGWTVLDLCAAPGGKSTHLAARLGDEGILVSNECVASRVKPLCSNLERIGAKNAVITSAMPDQLADAWGACFDAVVVDAPCSGEGMFRRDEVAVREWSREHVLGCAERQLLILEDAARMVAGGGILLYSTCTMNIHENEEVLDRFLSAHPEFTMEPITAVSLPRAFSTEIGLREEIALAGRLMPHVIPGEGHFIARLRKSGDEREALPFSMGKAPGKAEQKILQDFIEETFTSILWTEPTLRGDAVWLSPGDLPYAVRSGVCLGHFVRGRFEPDHSLFLAENADFFQRTVILSPDDPRMAAYLRGEQISADCGKGWCAVCVEAGGQAYPLGMGKASNGAVKNHYPKGLRNFK